RLTEHQEGARVVPVTAAGPAQPEVRGQQPPLHPQRGADALAAGGAQRAVRAAGRLPPPGPAQIGPAPLLPEPLRAGPPGLVLRSGARAALAQHGAEFAVQTQLAVERESAR